MERILALYDSDIFYVTRFMEYFKKKRDFGFEIVVFTGKDSLNDYLQRHTVEILLLGEQAAPEDFPCEKIKYRYRLTDDSWNGQDSGYPFISKYQAAQSLMSEIWSDYSRRENISGNKIVSGQMRVTAIFTPVPQLESLLFSWAKGLILSEQKKVLLILLELLPVPIITTADYTNQPLSELIFYLKEKSDVISKMKPLLLYEGKLSYLAGTANGADILAMNKEDVRRWVTELKTHTDYQEVIFYLCGFTEAAMEFIEQSEEVLLLSKDTLYDNAVIHELHQQMDRTGNNVLRDKMISLHLPEEESIKHLPVSIPELAATAVWNLAAQNTGLLNRDRRQIAY